MMTTKRKQWPKDNKPASFSDLVEPCKAAFLQGATWERVSQRKNIKWDGLPSGEEQLVTSFDFPQALRAKNLQYDLEDQGRDFLEVILGIAVRLGIEQGRRIQISSLEHKLDMLTFGLKMSQDALLDIPTRRKQKPKKRKPST